MLAMPVASVPAAILLALAPLIAIMPKQVPDGILLAPPLFDHAKIALVRAILRSGLPVPNPFIGPGTPGHIAYYYLWHFSTAVLASALHLDAWAAEAAMTGFTAFASLLLVMAIAVSLGGRTISIAAIVLLALAGSLRPVLATLISADAATKFIPRSADIGLWLNQAAWVPQHLASACCLIAAILVILKLAEKPGFATACVLGLLTAASFESSVWIGGFAFAAASVAVGCMLLLRNDHDRKIRFLLYAAVGAALAAALIAPFVLDELQAVHLRGGGAGVALHPYRVFGVLIPQPWRSIAALPAFWLVLLPFEMPALLISLAAAAPYFRTAGRSRESPRATALALVVLACLAVTWLCASTIDNNDLGWRAALPAILILMAASAVALQRLILHRRWPALALIAACIALALPDGARMLSGYFMGQRPGDPESLHESVAFWAAVAAHSAPSERIASNPLATADATPWPDNIAWSVLSDRSSCYAGWATVVAYGPLPRPELETTDALFTRVFAGKPQDGDIAALSQRYRCNVVAITDRDGAWAADPFGASTGYVLADRSPHWRIYRRSPNH